MSKRITLGIVGVVGLLWAVFPDPMPTFIDDIIIGLGGAAALLKLIVSFINNN